MAFTEIDGVLQEFCEWAQDESNLYMLLVVHCGSPVLVATNEQVAVVVPWSGPPPTEHMLPDEVPIRSANERVEAIRRNMPRLLAMEVGFRWLLPDLGPKATRSRVVACDVCGGAPGCSWCDHEGVVRSWNTADGSWLGRPVAIADSDQPARWMAESHVRLLRSLGVERVGAGRLDPDGHEVLAWAGTVDSDPDVRVFAVASESLGSMRPKIAAEMGVG